MRVTSLHHQAAEARRKAALPRFNLSAAGGFPPPVRVMALERAVERRASAAQQLESRGVPFQFFDAVDGDTADLPEEEVSEGLPGWAAAGLARSQSRPPVSAPAPPLAQVRWHASVRRRRAYFRGGPHAQRMRRKIAADLSHYRLMHQLLAAAP